MPRRSRATARASAVAGVHEVLSGSFGPHAYPLHVHETWTLLLVDRGEVRYRLGDGVFRATPLDVTLLPPGIPHDGAATTPAGFDKRVVHLHREVLDDAMAASAATRPRLTDPGLRSLAGQVHTVGREATTAADGAATRALDRLGAALQHALAAATPTTASGPDPRAAALRDRIEADLSDGAPLRRHAEALGWSERALVRAFTASYGIAPHRYRLSRRLEVARERLASGARPPEVAVDVGFHDQSHFSRHFTRHFGVTPATVAA